MKKAFKTALTILCCLLMLTAILVACKPKMITVTFDPNYDGAMLLPQTGRSGATFEAPNVSRVGYEFEGWYQSKDFSGSPQTFPAKLTADATFYAKWKEIEQEMPPVTLTAISAVYTGGSLIVGTQLDQSKVTVTATYSDNSSKAVSGYILSATSFDTTGNQTVTVSYTEKGVTKSATFNVTVVAATLERIEATYNGGKVMLGEQPDVTKLTVKAYYNNGTSKFVTNVNVGKIESATVGEKNWAISYTEDGVTKSDIVKINVVSGEVADMSIHFMTFGNLKSGDSIYIKAGDTDILIDAGSTQGSASVIEKYVKQYCTDGILEYVIVTHQDTDHIYAFTTSQSSGGGIFERFECKTIIDFPLYSGTASPTLNTYFERRDAEVAAGAKHYTALECYKEENGAQRVYELADGITMEILYHKYYEQKQSEPNNNSVCVLFTQGDNHYLFTGDLEIEGETSLIENNPNLPEVELFKAGHHGSENASNTVLLDVINPTNIVVSCVAGGQYNFPQQPFIDRVANYTQNVYVTGLKNSAGNYADMNGNIVFSCKDGVLEKHGYSYNNGTQIPLTKLKDTEWFAANRTCPAAWA